MTISKEKQQARIVSTLIYIFLIILAIVYIVPLLWVLITSLKDDSTLMLSPWAMPAAIEWGNYEFAWTKGHLGTAMLNSLIVCSTTLICGSATPLKSVRPPTPSSPTRRP